jgi:hypothetical protein
VWFFCTTTLYFVEYCVPLPRRRCCLAIQANLHLDSAAMQAFRHGLSIPSFQ